MKRNFNVFFSLIQTFSQPFFISFLHLQELGTPNRLVDASTESIIPATTGRRLRSLDTFRGYGTLPLIVSGPMLLRRELRISGANDIAQNLLFYIPWSWLSEFNLHFLSYYPKIE